MSKVPTVSMFATTTGTHASDRPLCLNLSSRSSVTSDRLRSVDRFGRMSTSLKSSFTSSSMRRQRGRSP